MRGHSDSSIGLSNQFDKISKFIKLMGNDDYLLRYSMMAKTTNEDSAHYTPENFLQVKSEFFEFLKRMKTMFPNLKFYAERPMFRCNFEEESVESYRKNFGVRFLCSMEFTIAPDGTCGLCPPIMRKSNLNKLSPVTPENFIMVVDSMREMTKTLQRKPSFDYCEKCKKDCQGGCLSYKF